MSSEPVSLEIIANECEICKRLEELSMAITLLQHRLKDMGHPRRQDQQHLELEPSQAQDRCTIDQPEHLEPKSQEVKPQIEDFVRQKGGRYVPARAGSKESLPVQQDATQTDQNSSD